MNLKTESNKLSEVNSPIFNKNKKYFILNKKNSLEKKKCSKVIALGNFNSKKY